MQISARFLPTHQPQLWLLMNFFALLLCWQALIDQASPFNYGRLLVQMDQSTGSSVSKMLERMALAAGMNLPLSSGSAGSGQSLHELMRQELAERQAKSQAESPQEEPAAPEDVLVTLQSITFRGATILGDRELSNTVAKYLGVPMTYEQLLEIGMTVESHYRQNNYLARVILPPQDLVGGVLQLEVIESVISHAEVEQRLAQMPNTESHLSVLLTPNHTQSKVQTAEKNDRSLAMDKHLTNVLAPLSLKDGKTAGDTELLLKMYQNRSLDADDTPDNAAAHANPTRRHLVSLAGFTQYPRPWVDTVVMTEEQSK